MYTYDPTEELNEAEQDLWREDDTKVSSSDRFPECHVDVHLSVEVFHVSKSQRWACLHDSVSTRTPHRSF